MPKQIWICEKCGSQWCDEKAAIDCEKRHQQPVEFRVLSWVSFDARRSNADEQAFPQRILVKLDLAKYCCGFDTATYALERIGPRGC